MEGIRTIDTTFLRDQDGTIFVELESIIEFIKPYLLKPDAVELEIRRGASNAMVRIADRNKNRWRIF